MMENLIDNYPLGKAKDYSGEKHNCLTVIRYVGARLYPTTKRDRAIYSATRYYECLCDCGNIKTFSISAVVTGASKSCGCLRSSSGWKSHCTTHGCASRKNPSFKREYEAWRSMKKRCKDSSHKGWNSYRHVEVCERWASSFENFFEDMGKAPEGYSLDRIDNAKGYEPDNCRWASLLQQANNKRSNRLIEYEGEIRTMAEWARVKGISYHMLFGRLKANWDLDRAFNQPSDRTKRQVKHEKD